MDKKAIKVDLSVFFEDERKMACILVDPSWKSVACLQKRVEHLFDICSVRFLSAGCFLPPQESIEIINFCSDLKAFVPKDSLEKRKKTKQSVNEELNFESNQQLGDESQKKRKFNCLQTCHSKKAKRSKNIFKNDHEIPHSTEVSNESSNLEENTIVPRIYKDDHKQCHASTPKIKNVGPEIAQIDHKEKISNGETITVPSPSKTVSTTVFNSSKLSNSHNPNNPFKKPKSNKTHIYFNEDGEIQSPKTKKLSKSALTVDKAIVTFRCPLSNVTNGIESQKPRIFHLLPKNTKNSTIRKQKIEIQEDIVLPHISIQNLTNEFSLTTEPTVTNNIVNESIEADSSLTKKGTSNNLALVMSSSIVSKNDEKQVNTKILNESHNEDTNVNETQSDLPLSSSNGIENVAETENKSQAESFHGNENVNESRSENQMQLSSLFGDVTNTQNQSQLGQTDLNKSETDNESQVQLSNVEGTVNETNNQSQMNVDETSVMSVECVDLSIDLDEEIKLDNVQEKHDLTADNKSIKSATSDVEEISEIIDLNESEDVTTEQNSASNIKIHKILPFTTDLVDLPKTEDIIVFKVSSMDKTKKSTNFIAGKVEYINKRTKVVKVFIIDGISELWNVPNNYISNLVDDDESVKYMQLKLSDMIEPKLYSTS